MMPSSHRFGGWYALKGIKLMLRFFPMLGASLPAVEVGQGGDGLVDAEDDC